jgi:hypothetical protein
MASPIGTKPSSEDHTASTGMRDAESTQQGPANSVDDLVSTMVDDSQGVDMPLFGLSPTPTTQRNQNGNQPDLGVTGVTAAVPGAADLRPGDTDADECKHDLPPF